MSVAALIPVFNRRKQVVRAVASALAQTLPPDEVIVVDDGSSDGTAAALRAEFGTRIVVIEQQNRGVSAARNRAVEAAHSEWVAFLDSDDLWLPTKLEQQFAAIRSMGPDFGACFTNCDYLGDPDKVATVFEEAGLPVDQPFGAVRNPIEYIIDDLGIMVQSLLVRRSLLQKVGGFDCDLGISEDRDLVLKLSFETRFCYASAPLTSIDRTPGVSRLTGRLHHKTDESYTCMQVLLERMLARCEIVDGGLYRRVHDELRKLYYAWAQERIEDFRFLTVFDKLWMIHKLGDTGTEICSRLLSNARRKLARHLRVT